MKLAALAILALPVMAEDIRIHVLGLFRPLAITIEAAWLHMAGERVALNQPLVCHAKGNEVECRLGQRVIGAAVALAGGPAITLDLPGKMRRTYAGQLTLQARDGILEPVMNVDLETAVAIAVAAELPGAPAEAAKAQAVAARSYYRAGARHNHALFCDTTHCQLFGGQVSSTHPAAGAAQATRSIVLGHKGRTVAGLYFRSCGGSTFSAGDVGLPAGGYPYYAVECSVCRIGPRTWETKLPASDAAVLLRESRSENGRLELARKFGWDRIPSNSFRASRQGEFILLRGEGEGHGVGLCQRGAQGLAARGYDFRSILRHYFPNTNLLQ